MIVVPIKGAILMASHKVIMRQPNQTEVSSDIEFIIKENGRKIGELHVSKGSIEWLPSNGRYKRRMRWSKFAEIMAQEKQVR
jgi:hypothetical protein